MEQSEQMSLAEEEVRKAADHLNNLQTAAYASTEERMYDFGLSSNHKPFEENIKEDATLINQLLELKNQMPLERRISYLEFRGKLISIIRHYNLPLDQSVHMLNCLDRYIPDCCGCNECHMRTWVLIERQIKDCR